MRTLQLTLELGAGLAVAMLCLGLVLLPGAVMAQEPDAPATEPAEMQRSSGSYAVASPLVERFMLDELRTLRTDIQHLRTEMIQEITDRELSVADRAMSYSNTTVTFFFYAFAGVTAVITMLGWTSLRDLRKSFSNVAQQEVTRVSSEYEARLTALEQQLQERGQEILANQQEIEKTQTIHALWLQANQASNARTKIEFYDRILELDPTDNETRAYKADAALQLGERDWALSLANRILEDDSENSLAYFQRACAYAGLGDPDSALTDLTKAIEISESLREQARNEEEFEPLMGHRGFRKLVHLPVEGEDEAEEESEEEEVEDREETT